MKRHFYNFSLRLVLSSPFCLISGLIFVLITYYIVHIIWVCTKRIRFKHQLELTLGGEHIHEIYCGFKGPSGLH